MHIEYVAINTVPWHWAHSVSWVPLVLRGWSLTMSSFSCKSEWVCWGLCLVDSLPRYEESQYFYHLLTFFFYSKVLISSSVPLQCSTLCTKLMISADFLTVPVMQTKNCINSLKESTPCQKSSCCKFPVQQYLLSFPPTEDLQQIPLLTAL